MGTKHYNGSDPIVRKLPTRKSDWDFSFSEKEPRLGHECHTNFYMPGRWLALASHEQVKLGLNSCFL